MITIGTNSENEDKSLPYDSSEAIIFTFNYIF